MFNGNAIKVDDFSVLPSLSLKNLGVFYDRHLSFDVHWTKMNIKVSDIPMYINRIQDSLSNEARLINNSADSCPKSPKLYNNCLRHY